MPPLIIFKPFCKENIIMTDTTDIITAYQIHEKALTEANLFNKNAVFDALAAAGITTVTVNFNGEGDSGQLEEVVAYSSEGPGQIPATSIKFRSTGWGNADPVLRDLPLADAIEDLCYGYLSQEHGGWENNDGAYGDFTFDTAARRIGLDLHARYTDSFHHSHTF
jgi:hypothetical protein